MNLRKIHDPPFFLAFFDFLAFFRFPISLAFLCVFPSFSKDFPLFFSGFPLLFLKSKGWRVRDFPFFTPFLAWNFGAIFRLRHPNPGKHSTREISRQIVSLTPLAEKTGEKNHSALRQGSGSAEFWQNFALSLASIPARQCRAKIQAQGFLDSGSAKGVRPWRRSVKIEKGFLLTPRHPGQNPKKSPVTPRIFKGYLLKTTLRGSKTLNSKIHP